jgi:hypothetical protein
MPESGGNTHRSGEMVKEQSIVDVYCRDQIDLFMII